MQGTLKELTANSQIDLWLVRVWSKHIIQTYQNTTSQKPEALKDAENAVQKQISYV